MSMQENDKAAAAVATGPRIALADIENSIKTIAFLNGAKFLAHADHVENNGKGHNTHRDASVMTICMVVTKTGFVVIGKAAPADPKNFDVPLGRKLAYEDCIKQLWPLMGFALKEKLADEESVLGGVAELRKQGEGPY